MEKMAALLPLLRIALDIDNSDPQHGKILAQYDYSSKNEKQNLNTISKILKLDKNAQKLYSYRHFLSFFEENFYKVYPNVFELNITGNNGKKQYFMGLKGEGLGIKI